MSGAGGFTGVVVIVFDIVVVIIIGMSNVVVITEYFVQNTFSRNNKINISSRLPK